MRRWVWLLGLLSMVDCGGDDDRGDDTASGGTSMSGGAGGAADAGAGGARPEGGAGGGSSTGGSESGAGGDAGGVTTPGSAGASGAGTGPGPAGGAAGFAGESGAAGESGSAGAAGESGVDELANVFNLVDAAAAAELEAFLIAGDVPLSLWAPGRLPLCVNGFLERYLEEYDFLFFMTDHDIATNYYGLSETVYSPMLPGTGVDIRYRRPGYNTNGRLKTIAGFKYVPGGYGPFAHEILHFWANRLDPSFGFGVGAPGHWGNADVHGQLGGYDPAHLDCVTPAGAKPPNCTAVSAGRYRYVTPFFAPNANGADIPYALFELYLMGLVARAQIPAELHVLENATRVSTGTNVVMEASGIRTVSVADIVARHGEVPLRKANERAFRLAMIVVSVRPAPPNVLTEIAHAIAAFGNRSDDLALPSFEALTGGRAKLDTRLGKGRLATDPRPTAVPLPECNVHTQDCGVAGAGCFLNGNAPFCALSGGRERDEACTGTIQCAPGSTCVTSPTRTGMFCAPYCEANDTTSPLYCPNLCTQYIRLGRADGSHLTGQCTPN